MKILCVAFMSLKQCLDTGWLPEGGSADSEGSGRADVAAAASIDAHLKHTSAEVSF